MLVSDHNLAAQCIHMLLSFFLLLYLYWQSLYVWIYLCAYIICTYIIFYIYMYTCRRVYCIWLEGLLLPINMSNDSFSAIASVQSAGDELDGSWFLGELVLLIDCVVALHQSKVVSTHLWNTPRATFYQQAVKGNLSQLGRGIAWGVRYRGVLYLSWNQVISTDITPQKVVSVGVHSPLYEGFSSWGITILLHHTLQPFF